MDRAEVQSSNIKSVGYDEKTKTLEVEFIKKGKVFQYSPITREGYDLLMQAESIGEFFSKHIRNNPQVTCTPV